jgi:prepilin signal peptidase PulO-like enzyme (type II secretory pathway)
VFAGQLGLQSTYVFLFAFILFLGLAVFSKGQFGFGDALVLGALGWYYHTFTAFQTFLFTLAIVGIPWAIYWTWHYGKKQGYSNLIRAFRKTISIDDAQPGMVLAKDRFMNGLTQKDIDKMKQAGSITIDVKQPFPFIPVIFIAFLITLFL